MDFEDKRKCRCGGERFNAHQLARHDVVVDATGNYREDLGIFDVEHPYGSFSCTQCHEEYEKLNGLEIEPAEEVTTTCLNGKLHFGDIVISTPDDEYACLVGTVLAINLLGTPEHDAETDNDTDDIHVNFMDSAYTKLRMREISKVFSALYGEKKHFSECPIDDVIMSPECLIRITGIDDDILMRLLASEEGGRLFCAGVIATVYANNNIRG